MRKGNMNRLGILAAAFLAGFWLQPETVQAVETISNVKVSFELEEFDNAGMPVLNVETDNEKYSAGSLMTLEEYAEDVDDDDHGVDNDLLLYNQVNLEKKDLSELVYVVELEASEGYRFSGNRDKIMLSGAGARYVESERNDSRTTLTVYIKFSDLDDMTGDVKKASWNSDGRGMWSQAQGAMKYELRLYLQGKILGSTKVTGGTSYDFRPLMQKAGIYSYWVRPVSAIDDKGKWKQSEEFQASEEMAMLNNNQFQVKMVLEGDGKGPDSAVSYINTGWQQTEEGLWWYREQDGSYPQKNWLNDNGFWYFFDDNGYMVKECYVKWGNLTYFFNKDGRMMTGGQTPDGRLAGTDGALSWPRI